VVTVSLLDRPRPSQTKAGRLGRIVRQDGLNRRGSLERRDPRSAQRATIAALVLACAAIATIDATSGLGGVRSVAGEIFGPAESASSTVFRPVTSISDWAHTNGQLRGQVHDLQQQNAQLASQLHSSDFDRNQLAEYDGLTRSARQLGYALVPARVVAYGPAQSFSRTVTIDAGSNAGVTAAMTVVDADGLVGRVLSTTSTTATVLLVVDPDSTIGGRVGSSMDAGLITGTGALDSGGALDLQLLDQSDTPAKGDAVVSWGAGQAPYVSGVPIGEVTHVYSSVRDSSKTVEIKPYVDFGALDVVGVVVPSGTRSDRAVIDADGSLK
jgi:rod shape-determining protein MreC